LNLGHKPIRAKNFIRLRSPPPSGRPSVLQLEYVCYDINEYRFQMMKLEVSHPLAATTNSEVVANGEDTSGLAADYYDILQKIIECTFSDAKEMKVVFLNVIGLIQSTAPEWMILVWWR
jgi:hypothetical protein